MLATGLSASWLPALWVVFRARGVAQWRILVVVLATTLTGFVLVSTVYVWPKMLAGTFALAALAIVVSRDEADRRLASGVVAVALVTLSVLAHGGTVFALLALIPFAYRLRRRITVRAVAACAAVAVACYLPWTLYQHFVDPPGDRLLKWQLAGVIPIDPRGFLQTIVQQYERLSPHGLLANKGMNLLSLAADPVLWRTQLAEPGLDERVSRLRAARAAQRPPAGDGPAAAGRGRAARQVLAAGPGAGGAARGLLRARARLLGGAALGRRAGHHD